MQYDLLAALNGLDPFPQVIPLAHLCNKAFSRGSREHTRDPKKQAVWTRDNRRPNPHRSVTLWLGPGPSHSSPTNLQTIHSHSRTYIPTSSSTCKLPTHPIHHPPLLYRTSRNLPSKPNPSVIRPLLFLAFKQPNPAKKKKEKKKSIKKKGKSSFDFPGL